MDEVVRPYTVEDVKRLQGSLIPEYTVAKVTARKLRRALQSKYYTHALGCMTGGQAVQCVRAGLKAIYMSGWQVAGDANLSGQTYPDQSLYPANSVPSLVKRVNNALARMDQIEIAENGEPSRDWYVPIIADAEAGFGGVLNAFELMKQMIEAGAAGVHFEDQLSSEKKCGHLGGKCLVPTQEFIKKLVAARLAADVCETPTVIIARTDANAAKLITSDVDPYDHPFIERDSHGEKRRTSEGFYRLVGGLDQAIARGLAYAPYADLIWCETSHPDLGEAKAFAEAIHEKFPGKMLAYNCSPSFNWRAHLDEQTIQSFQAQLAEMGYRFQFITLAGWHALNHSMFELALNYHADDMLAYAHLQDIELESQTAGYTAVKHQREVGTSYFDAVRNVIDKDASTGAMQDSTEEEQF